MEKKWPTFVVAIVVSLLVTACSLDKNEQDNIAALVNEEPITVDDLHTGVDQWEMSLEIQTKADRQNNESIPEIPEALQADFEQFLLDMNVTPADLSEEQEAFLKSQYTYFKEFNGNADFNNEEYRYIKRAYNNIVFAPDESEALSRQIRDMVLYQEALKQGFQVPETEAREMYKTIITPKELEPESEEYFKYLEYLKIEDEVIKKHGYQSREAYLNQQFTSYAKSISIARLKNSFLEEWMVQYPDLQGYEYRIKSENAWYDYTENLVNQVDIEICIIAQQ